MLAGDGLVVWRHVSLYIVPKKEIEIESHASSWCWNVMTSQVIEFISITCATYDTVSSPEHIPHY